MKCKTSVKTVNLEESKEYDNNLQSVHTFFRTMKSLQVLANIKKAFNLVNKMNSPIDARKVADERLFSYF